jgi:hypothetical protein
MIQPKFASVKRLRSGENGWNSSSSLPGKKAKTLRVDQQSPYGNGQFVQLSDCPNRSWMGIFKMPIGPFGMYDQIGLDTIAEILGHWAEILNDGAVRRRVEYLKKWTSQGFLGAKSSRGFYRYPARAYVGSGFLSEGKVSSNSVLLTDRAQ